MPTKEGDPLLPTDNSKLTTTLWRFTENMAVVLLSVASGNSTVTTISRHCKKDKGNVCRTLSVLMKKGLITQQDKTDQYFLSSFGKDAALRLTTDKAQVTTKTTEGHSTDNSQVTTRKRGHNFRVKFKIIRAPQGWKESPKQFFRLQDLAWEDLNLKQVDAVQFSYDNYFVKAMKENVVVFVDVQQDEDSMIVLERLIKRAWEFKIKIERKWPELQLSDVPKVTTQEFAHEKDIVARIKEKYTVIRHKDGYVRVQIDRSKGLELEFMHPGMSDSDSERWQEQVISILDSPYLYGDLAVKTEQEEIRNDDQDATLQEIKRLSVESARQILENSRQLNYHAENMVSHVKAVQGIEQGISKFGDVVDTNLKGLRQAIIQEIRQEIKRELKRAVKGGQKRFLSKPSGPHSSSQLSLLQFGGA